MNYPKEYLRQIQAGKIAVSKEVRAVYERECSWMDNPPNDSEWNYRFDEELGQRHIDFMQKFCKQSKGKHGGKEIRFDLFQLAKLQLVFGWIDKDTGFRRIREVFDLRGRKCGKSTETAAVCHDLLINDKESGPEVYCVANSKDQARLVFSECVNMRKQSPALKAIEKKRQSDIYCEPNFGFIKALAAKTDNLDGLNATFVSQDECHEQRDSQLYDVMKQSQAERDQPLYWIITTNGFRREAFFDAKFEVMQHISFWEEGYRDYKTLPLLYKLDSRDEWTNPKAWEKANPGLGKIKSIETLREHVEQAKRDPQFLPTVLTKDFNMPENSNEGWLTFEEAVNTEVVSMEYLEHSYAIGGCDLSATTDLTCASLYIKKPNDEKAYVLQQYFIPQSKMDKLDATRSDKEAPYKLWAEQGWLTICEGATVDYHAVTEWFVSMVVEHDIRPLWVCYDAALSGYWAPEMTEYGFDMEKIRQGPITWTYPMKQLKGDLENNLVVYQNNPILRWCLMNTAKKSTNRDGIESIQPVKISSTRRIDGMVSLLNAYVGFQKHIDDFLPYLR